MSAITKTFITEKEYIEKERKALTKSEYYNGEVFAMAGASRYHNRIVASTIAAISQQLKNRSCHFYPSDLRVHNKLNTLYTYTDVIIVCGKEEYLDDEFDTLLNPTVLIEVLSPSTERYDRGEKFKLYRSIPSLENYVMISSTEAVSEVFTWMENNEWKLNLAKHKDDSIHISAINNDLALKDIYEQVGNFVKEK